MIIVDSLVKPTHYLKGHLVMVCNMVLSDLYYSGGVGTRTITDNFQTTYGNTLNITHGGETELDTRFAIGYMPFRSTSYDYFVECGLSAFPHDVTYNERAQVKVPLIML